MYEEVVIDINEAGAKLAEWTNAYLAQGYIVRAFIADRLLVLSRGAKTA